MKRSDAFELFRCYARQSVVATVTGPPAKVLMGDEALLGKRGLNNGPLASGWYIFHPRGHDRLPPSTLHALESLQTTQLRPLKFKSGGTRPKAGMPCLADDFYLRKLDATFKEVRDGGPAFRPGMLSATVFSYEPPQQPPARAGVAQARPGEATKRRKLGGAADAAPAIKGGGGGALADADKIDPLVVVFYMRNKIPVGEGKNVVNSTQIINLGPDQVPPPSSAAFQQPRLILRKLSNAP